MTTSNKFYVACLEQLVQTVGNYAARKGDLWRVSEGCEIMDAYEACLVEKLILEKLKKDF